MVLPGPRPVLVSGTARIFDGCGASSDLMSAVGVPRELVRGRTMGVRVCDCWLRCFLFSVGIEVGSVVSNSRAESRVVSIEAVR
jgi:hypothetical protein